MTNYIPSQFYNFPLHVKEKCPKSILTYRKDKFSKSILSYGKEKCPKGVMEYLKEKVPKGVLGHLIKKGCDRHFGFSQRKNPNKGNSRIRGTNYQLCLKKSTKL